MTGFIFKWPLSTLLLSTIMITVTFVNRRFAIAMLGGGGSLYRYIYKKRIKVKRKDQLSPSKTIQRAFNPKSLDYGSFENVLRLK